MEQKFENEMKRIIIEALGNTNNVEDIVNASYEKKPKEYYEAYRNSTAISEDVNLFNYYPAIRKPILEKLSGIVEYSFSNQSFLELYSIIRKTHPRIFKCVVSNTRISYKKWKSVLMSETDFFEDKSELEIFCNKGVFSFLFHIEEKYKGRQIHVENLEDIFDYVTDRRKHNRKCYKQFLMFHRLPPYENEPIKDIEYLPTLEHAKKLAHFNKYFDHIINSELVEHYTRENNKKAYLNLPDAIQIELRQKIFSRGGKASILGYYTSLLKSFGILEHYFELPITELDVYNLQDTISELHKSNNLPNEQEDYVIPSLMMIALVKEIQQLKKLIYNPSKEHIEFEYNRHHENETNLLKEENEALKAKIEELQRQNQVEKQEVISAKEQLNIAQSTINDLTKMNERLEKTISDFEEDKKELNHLKQFVFNSDYEDEQLSSEDDKHASMINSLKDLKIVVIGGHENWVEKLKSTFPDFIYLTPEAATNRAIKNINYDYILFNVNKNSHGAYYRLQKELSRSKILYANHANIERTVTSLYQQIFN